MVNPQTDIAGTERSAKLRAFYARYVTKVGAVGDPRIQQAFAAVPREPFAGPAPWYVLVGFPRNARPSAPAYIETPDDDPAFLYQDYLIALDRTRGINIGEPSLHARCLEALALRNGETVLHVGTGSGYYTAILAQLVGPTGRVFGREIDPGLAERSKRNLVPWPWVEVQARSGAEGSLPEVDAIYVNAGLTQPSPVWLDVLRPGGRLMFPLQAERSLGGMLLLQKPEGGNTAWPARFVSRAGFISCRAPQVEATGNRLIAAFGGGGWDAVQSFHHDDKPDDTSWFSANGWWLSTRPASHTILRKE